MTSTPNLCSGQKRSYGFEQVGEEEDWVCSMHPFSSMRSCALPEDTTIVKAFAGDDFTYSSFHFSPTLACCAHQSR